MRKQSALLEPPENYGRCSTVANLQQRVMQFLTPHRMQCVAAAVGLTPDVGRQATLFVVPLLLTELNKVAQVSEGLQKIADNARLEGETISRLAEMLDAVEALSIGPSHLMPSLLRAPDRDLITDALGKFAGLDKNKAAVLTELVLHVILGTVGQEQRDRRLSTTNIAQLLDKQKDYMSLLLTAGSRDQPNSRS
jgi:Bacterial protein of unknown function (DUF937)